MTVTHYAARGNKRGRQDEDREQQNQDSPYESHDRIIEEKRGFEKWEKWSNFFGDQIGSTKARSLSHWVALARSLQMMKTSWAVPVPRYIHLIPAGVSY
jgi:hypothetical protein